ncbi:hypothetical protein D3C85_1862120 [compost metagenome]
MVKTIMVMERYGEVLMLLFIITCWRIIIVEMLALMEGIEQGQEVAHLESTK